MKELDLEEYQRDKKVYLWSHVADEDLDEKDLQDLEKETLLEETLEEVLDQDYEENNEESGGEEGEFIVEDPMDLD